MEDILNAVFTLRGLSVLRREAEVDGVTYRRHHNPDGSIGGWVAGTAQVPRTVHVCPKAFVVGEAKLLPGMWVADGLIIQFDHTQLEE